MKKNVNVNESETRAIPRSSRPMKVSSNSTKWRNSVKFLGGKKFASPRDNRTKRVIEARETRRTLVTRGRGRDRSRARMIVAIVPGHDVSRPLRRHAVAIAAPSDGPPTSLDVGAGDWVAGANPNRTPCSPPLPCHLSPFLSRRYLSRLSVAADPSSAVYLRPDELYRPLAADTSSRRQLRLLAPPRTPPFVLDQPGLSMRPEVDEPRRSTRPKHATLPKVAREFSMHSWLT